MTIISTIGKMLVGLVALLISMPMFLVAVLFMLSFSHEKVDWLMEHSPIWLWWDYLERK